MGYQLELAGELSKETVFLNGTKLETCANKYTFVWKKSVGKWEEKMSIKIQEAVRLAKIPLTIRRGCIQTVPVWDNR